MPNWLLSLLSSPSSAFSFARHYAEVTSANDVGAVIEAVLELMTMGKWTTPGAWLAGVESNAGELFPSLWKSYNPVTTFSPSFSLP